ncbi:MAG TPA: MFS transporter [Solirubrobacteraceae bacterium]|nr:MFS transporter [Solirubrobacteraceae bacterium]
MSTQSIDRTRPRGDLRAAIASVRASRWTPLPIILTATFMVVLDFFIVNVALPAMQSELHASAGSVEWVVAGYALTSAVLLIAASRLGDRFGRRRLFTLGLTVFTVGSAGCGIAPNATLLVVARLLQGVGAAMLMPNVLALIGALYDGPDRLRALSAYGMAMGLAAVGGQLLGGVLLAANPAGLGWRTVFLINLPIGAGALALTRLVPESRAPHGGRVDVAGTALATAAVTAIVLPLVEGQAHGWPLWTWVSLGLAPLLVGAFVVQQRRLAAAGGDPLLAPGLFASRAFTAGLVGQLVFWCGQASFFLVLALYLQQGRGMSALHSGLVFTILAVAYLATSLRAPALTAVHGRSVLAVGALALATGHALLVGTVLLVGDGGSVLALTPGLIFVGAGMGLGITPLATLVMNSAPAEHVGSVSGVLATAQNVGNAIGVAGIGAIFYGALHHGFAVAFERGVGTLAVVLLVVAALTRLLPGRVR